MPVAGCRRVQKLIGEIVPEVKAMEAVLQASQERAEPLRAVFSMDRKPNITHTELVDVNGHRIEAGGEERAHSKPDRGPLRKRCHHPRLAGCMVSQLPEQGWVQVKLKRDPQRSTGIRRQDCCRCDGITVQHFVRKRSLRCIRGKPIGQQAPAHGQSMHAGLRQGCEPELDGITQSRHSRSGPEETDLTVQIGQ
jgi:hypothetical protein